MLHKLILAVLGLQAAVSPVFGNPLPQGGSADLAAVDELEALAQLAFEKTEEVVNGEDIEKRNGCHIFNMRIRREW